jgi:hypothetical protein
LGNDREERAGRGILYFRPTTRSASPFRREMPHGLKSRSAFAKARGAELSQRGGSKNATTPRKAPKCGAAGATSAILWRCRKRGTPKRLIRASEAVRGVLAHVCGVLSLHHVVFQEIEFDTYSFLQNRLPLYCAHINSNDVTPVSSLTSLISKERRIWILVSTCYVDRYNTSMLPA